MKRLGICRGTGGRDIDRAIGRDRISKVATGTEKELHTVARDPGA